ncbi:glycosyltransferase family 4 protein [Calothrix sp. 336/3]|uniref:glycosyltransferase family 4 protein n=1 Tax=Calothrix sp. 336/3 TaxID=1337936 RepID=UPI0004E43B7E|nr:glycosyltransferase family 4 protein [Calothrix sp. 336/3]AKG22109.1 glycosyl transferase family 1 [Calothrix sp. 336/3]
MKILFLDQSGKPGGAELCLIDIAKPYRETSLVGLFADGEFKNILQENQIPVQILTQKSLQVRKESSLFQALGSVGQLIPLVQKVAQLAKNYDCIYANTQKALVVGALGSFLSDRPLIYHLHDILSPEHFSNTNRRVAVTLANRFASLVIANSQASKTAFIQAGGRSEITEIVYNGFHPQTYEIPMSTAQEMREKLGLSGKYIVGHFSRLAPWKGQHILLEALSKCPEDVAVILVGDALFGEQDYVQKLHQQVADLGLTNRVKFLGFRSDIPQLMAACDVVTHTSTAPEPFGRVIVEAMLCGKPIIAAKAGGAMELVENEVNGFLVEPGKSEDLALVISDCFHHREKTGKIAENARLSASQRFDVVNINQQIAQLLLRVLPIKP